MIEITESAKTRLAKLAKEKPGTMLRVYLKAGGCNGVEICFALAEKADRFDLLLRTTEGISLLIDQKSEKVLGDATLDWAGSSLGTKKFTIKSANQKTTCGCGSSFGI